MPHYYFHLRTIDSVEHDVEGITFPNLEEAKADARASLFEMMADDTAASRAITVVGIDITDSQGTMIASVDVQDR